MSTSYNSGVVLGVKLSEIGFNSEFISVPFEVHDKKGKPTGKFEKEKSWKINFQGKETIQEELYSDTIDELLNIQKPLSVFDNRGYDEKTDDKIVIGIGVASRDYNDYSGVKEINILDNSFVDKFELVKSELEKQFGVNVNPKLYFYFEIG